MATNPLSNRKPGAVSQNFGYKPQPEVGLGTILDLESAKCREYPQKLQRNVGIAVPHKQALTNV